MTWFAIVYKVAKKYWWAILLVLALLAFGVWKSNFAKDNQQIGATEERNRSLEGVVENVEKANTARAEIADTTRYAKFCECMQSTRTPAACKRYLPSGHVNTGKPASVCGKQ